MSLDDKYYLEWIKEIVEFYKYDNKDRAISSLETLLSKVSSNNLKRQPFFVQFL
ncbi:hypothetical protein GUT183_11260 [Streptococcus ruminantium]|nr:hypothetical protein GUT183_11260 [Streptococcus ruminantium]